MATVPDLTTEAQGLLKKAARVTADATDLLRWFNDCQRRLQPLAKIKRKWTVTVTSGSDTVSLAVASYPIFRLNRVRWKATGDEEGEDVTILAMDAFPPDGIRFQEALPGETNHTLYLWDDELTGTLELFGELMLTDLTNDASSIPQIPAHFHNLYPLYAAMRFGGQDEDFGGDGRFANFRSEYFQREAEFAADASSRLKSGGRRIRTSGGWA